MNDDGGVSVHTYCSDGQFTPREHSLSVFYPAVPLTLFLTCKSMYTNHVAELRSASDDLNLLTRENHAMAVCIRQPISCDIELLCNIIDWVPHAAFV